MGGIKIRKMQVEDVKLAAIQSGVGWLRAQRLMCDND